MLRNTFLHLPGIGSHRERAIWERGILDWEQFLAAAEKGSLPGRALDSAVPMVCRSLEAVAVGDPGFFKSLLPSREAWRLYPEFADRAVFLDIETTGLSGYYDEVTVIGALSRDGLALFVQDMNRLPLFLVQVAVVFLLTSRLAPAGNLVARHFSYRDATPNTLQEPIS